MIDHAGDNNSELQHRLGTASDAEIEQIIRDRVETLYHPTCTARMAPKDDGGVVDPLLRVHGVDGLRVCDASVFPQIPAAHTQAPVIAVAERCADIVKAAA